MSDSSHIVTTYCFKGKDYLVKMNIFNRNTLEVKVTDKITSEDWHCSYDSTYIENLTHKTGNYKQFEIFTTMLKSGLLKTSECISLDLLTFDDLEALRSRRAMGRTFPPHSAHVLPASTTNRRYLILTYTVEFDRIHYPLPMEYCGLPDPHILQATIRRLEQEVNQLQEKLKLASKTTQIKEHDDELLQQVNILERRLEEMTLENEELRNEVNHLTSVVNKKHPSYKRTEDLYKELSTLETQVQKERSILHQQVRRLKEEKSRLMCELEECKSREKCLRNQLGKFLTKNSTSHNTLIRSSRINPFRKGSPSRSTTDHHSGVTLFQDNLLTNGGKKVNNKRSPLPISKSDFPLTHRNRRNSSASSNEKSTRRCPSCSPHRSCSSNESTNPRRTRTQCKSKVKKKISIIDNTSSDSSSSIRSRYKAKNSKNITGKSKSSKDVKKETKIIDLEQRISNLQEILESDMLIL